MDKDSTTEILRDYSMLNSVNAVVLKTGYSWQKVVKTLSTNGVVLNDLHSKILEMIDSGKSVEEIGKTLNIAQSTVRAYSPRVRPVYGENLSDNAKSIRKYREKKRIENQGI